MQKNTTTGGLGERDATVTAIMSRQPETVPRTVSSNDGVGSLIKRRGRRHDPVALFRVSARFEQNDIPHINGHERPKID